MTYYDESQPGEQICSECGTPASGMVDPAYLDGLREIERAARAYVAVAKEGPFVDDARAFAALLGAVGGAS